MRPIKNDTHEMTHALCGTHGVDPRGFHTAAKHGITVVICAFFAHLQVESHVEEIKRWGMDIIHERSYLYDGPHTHARTHTHTCSRHFAPRNFSQRAYKYSCATNAMYHLIWRIKWFLLHRRRIWYISLVFLLFVAQEQYKKKNTLSRGWYFF